MCKKHTGLSTVAPLPSFRALQRMAVIPLYREFVIIFSQTQWSHRYRAEQGLNNS